MLDDRVISNIILNLDPSLWPSNPQFHPQFDCMNKSGWNCGLFYETGFRRFCKIFFWQGNFFFVFFIKKIQITMFSQFMSLPLTKAKNGGPTQLGIEILPGQWGGALKSPNSFFYFWVFTIKRALGVVEVKENGLITLGFIYNPYKSDNSNKRWPSEWHLWSSHLWVLRDECQYMNSC